MIATKRRRSPAVLLSESNKHWDRLIREADATEYMREARRSFLWRQGFGYLCEPLGLITYQRGISKLSADVIVSIWGVSKSITTPVISHHISPCGWRRLHPSWRRVVSNTPHPHPTVSSLYDVLTDFTNPVCTCYKEREAAVRNVQCSYVKVSFLVLLRAKRVETVKLVATVLRVGKQNYIFATAISPPTIPSLI